MRFCVADMKTEKFSVVGHRVNRVEGYEKVTGEARYVGDVVLPGMLIGRILRSPYPHARIVRIDTGKAERLRGVRAVVTAEDTIKQGRSEERRVGKECRSRWS